MSDEIVPVEIIENKIFLIRGQKVMLDSALANLYGVKTSSVNRQVRRNIDRFPSDFMFQLTKEEAEYVRCQIGTLNLRSQFVTLKQGKHYKYMPFAFTEHGILMLSSVLNSPRAIQVNIAIMRTFTRLRKLLATHSDLRRKLAELEKKYDSQFKIVFNAINEMLAEPPTKVKGVGFRK